MPSPDLTRKLLAAGLFVLPVTFVKVAGVYLGKAGPVEAQAASTDSAATPAANAVVKAPVWSSKQLAASKYIISLRAQPFAPTPFLYDTVQPQATSTSSDPVETVKTPADASAPKFVLQAILSSSIGKTALIDGKPYHEGDAVRETGWVIESIAVEKRSVTLKDPSTGRTVTIAVEIPAIKSQ